MHNYSIDRSPRVRILFALSALAIYVAPIVNAWLSQGLEALRDWTGSPKAIALAVPTFLLFTGIYFVVNKWFWRARILRRLLLVPDLNGTWQCNGRTTTRRGAMADIEWLARIEIVQSWSQLSIHLTTSQSGSWSTTASVRAHAHGYRINYTYKNEPRPGEDDLAVHDGIAEIDLDRDCRTASGHYFTDQHRQTSGTMRWTRE